MYAYKSCHLLLLYKRAQHSFSMNLGLFTLRQTYPFISSETPDIVTNGADMAAKLLDYFV